MSIHYSLRFRIVAAFAIFGFILGVLYAAFLYGSVHWSEDLAQQSRLEVEAADFLAHFAKNPDTPMLSNRDMTSGWGVDAFDPSIRAHLLSVPLGITEFNLDDFDAHVGKFMLEGQPEPLYIVYNVSQTEPLDSFTGIFYWLLVIGVLITTACGLMLGMMTAQRVISPLVSLARQVERMSPDNLQTDFDTAYGNDEVGLLARTISASNKRLAEFIRRERQFTANASHELRTPVTVVKGAAELIRSMSDDTRIAAPLKRLDRGVKEMEHLIQLFLTLAREGDLAQPEAAIDVYEVVQQVLAESRHIVEEKTVTVKVNKGSTVAVLAPKSVLKVVIGNLVRNAFTYTNSGSVTLSINDSRFKIEDTGPGFPENRIGTNAVPETDDEFAAGHGLGLGIVSDFCRRYGWQLSLANVQPHGASVQVVFHSP